MYNHYNVSTCIPPCLWLWNIFPRVRLQWKRRISIHNPRPTSHATQSPFSCPISPSQFCYTTLCPLPIGPYRPCPLQSMHSVRNSLIIMPLHQNFCLILHERIRYSFYHLMTYDKSRALDSLESRDNEWALIWTLLQSYTCSQRVTYSDTHLYNTKSNINSTFKTGLYWQTLINQHWLSALFPRPG